MLTPHRARGPFKYREWIAASLVASMMLLAPVPSPAELGTQMGVPSDAKCELLYWRVARGFVQPRNGGSISSIEQSIVTPFVKAATSPGQVYYPPTQDQAERFQCAHRFARRGSALSLVKAATLAASLSYDVVLYDDTVSGSIVVFEEWRCTDPRLNFRLRSRCGPFQAFLHGWGLYVIARQQEAGQVGLAVEVPHPSSGSCAGGDQRTQLAGVKTFQSARAKHLFIAGTCRFAATPPSAGAFECSSSANCHCPEIDQCPDMAHQDFSIFQGLHEEVIHSFGFLSRVSRIYQPHGFNAQSHPNCQHVVVSGAAPTAALNPTPLAEAVRDALIDDVGTQYHQQVLLYDEQSWESCDFGSARNNQQAIVTYAVDPSLAFISIESSGDVRNDQASLDELSSSAADALINGP